MNRELKTEFEKKNYWNKVTLHETYQYIIIYRKEFLKPILLKQYTSV